MGQMKNFLLIRSSLKWTHKKILLEKFIVKKYLKKLCVFQNLYFFLMFFAYNFLRNIVLGPFQRIWKQLKIVRFLYPILILLKIFGARISTVHFANLGCKCSKNGSFKLLCKK
jgi:hypothetical protein